MAWMRAAGFAALFLFGASQADAQDVTLTSPDGAVEISGTLLGFDGEFYRVETKFGDLTVDGSGVSCDGPGCPNLVDFVAELTFSGSSAMAEVLLPALIEGFALRNGYKASRTALDGANFDYGLRNPETGSTVARFYFRVTNTDEGFADLLANETDVVMAQREIRDPERKLALEIGLGDMTDSRRSRVLALDAIVPVVSPTNPVQRISLPELAKVFSGEINNWKDLGGPDAPIALHLPELGSGLAQSVEDRLLTPAKLTAHETVQRHRPSNEVPKVVSTDPFAIGIVSHAEVGPARALTLTGSCGFSLAASRRTIKTEDYPLTSPMFLYLPARRLPKVARDFLQYARSPAAQIVIRRAGFVDQSPEPILMNAQGDRLANAIASAGPETSLKDIQRLVSTLSPMMRLTTSFRFEAGSTRPDAQSRANIRQLAHHIETGRFDAKTLMFVGFSDGDGAASGNQKIARKRAKAVRDAVLQEITAPDQIHVDIQVEAFGEAMPMACDDSEWGRKVNRRVEVWQD